jgi:hypothetical protein
VRRPAEEFPQTWDQNMTLWKRTQLVHGCNLFVQAAPWLADNPNQRGHVSSLVRVADRLRVKKADVTPLILMSALGH